MTDEWMTERVIWPAGDGEMAGRIRAHDWAATPLGAIEYWPQSLRTAVDLVLGMPGPATLMWGERHIQLYNDAYLPIAGERHPGLLGRPVAEGWPDAYAEVIAPLLEAVGAGRASRLTDFPVQLAGPDGRLSERVFDTDWSPIRDETGLIAGALQTLVEVTDRQRTQAALHASEARHRLLVESWAQAVWETDPEGVVSTDSPSWRAYTGQTEEEEWLGYGWLDAIHPDDRADAERQWRDAIAARGVVDAEFRLRAPGGSWRWTNVRAVPVLGDGGEIESWAGINIDIDARKRAEAALAESEELRRLAVESGGMGTWRWDLREKLIWGDAAFLSFWGYPPSEASRCLADFTDQMSPRGQAEMSDMVTRAIDAGEVFDGQLAVVSGPTVGHWVRWRGRAERERPWIVNGVSFDVTEQRGRDQRLRESEERQTFLLDLSDALRAVEGVDGVGRTAAGMIADTLDLDRVYFVTADLAEDRIEVTHDVTRTNMPPMLGSYDSSAFPDALREFMERPIIYTDVRTDPRLSEHDRQSFAGLSAVGFAAVPIRRGSGTLIWAIGAVSARPRRWAADDITLLEEAAERTWAAIERTKADAALRASKQALAADLAGTSLLAELSARLVTEESLATINEEILAAAIAITRADTGTVQVYEPETKSLVLLATSGLEAEMTDHFHRIDASSTTGCGIALREGRRTFIDFDREDADEASQRHVAAGLRSALATPLVSRTGAPLGMLNTHWRASGHRPSERELRFLDLLARQAADLIERAQAQQQVRESEERLRLALEVGRLAAWDWDLSTGNVQWSDEHYRMQGYAIGEIAPSYEAWAARVHPHDLPGTERALQAARDGGGNYAHEFRSLHPEGAVRWLSAYGRFFRDDRGTPRRMVGAMMDVTERREWAERQKVLLAELQHRVRNILAVIRSIVSRTDDGERSTKDYAQHLQGRLSALARTQVLLTRRAGGGVDLEDMLRDELVAQAADDSQFTLDGPDVELSPKAAEVLTLAVHELATNATKYGAFSRPGGQLIVAWQVELREQQRWLVLRWTERGVPVVDAAPRREGFGSELISRRIPYELKGSGSFVLRPGGLESHIEFPLRPGDSILQTNGVG